MLIIQVIYIALGIATIIGCVLVLALIAGKLERAIRDMCYKGSREEIYAKGLARGAEIARKEWAEAVENHLRDFEKTKFPEMLDKYYGEAKVIHSEPTRIDIDTGESHATAEKIVMTPIEYLIRIQPEKNVFERISPNMPNEIKDQVIGLENYPSGA